MGEETQENKREIYRSIKGKYKQPDEDVKNSVSMENNLFQKELDM